MWLSIVTIHTSLYTIGLRTKTKNTNTNAKLHKVQKQRDFNNSKISNDFTHYIIDVRQLCGLYLNNAIDYLPISTQQNTTAIPTAILPRLNSSVTPA
jgi:hypothetical protein